MNPKQNLSLTVLEYICSHILTDQSPAYILLDKKGHVQCTGGKINDLITPPIQNGIDISDTLHFMQGLLPLDESPLMLSHVSLDSGATVTVYLYQTDEGHGLLFLDVTEQETMIAEMQQKANELVLLREKQTSAIEKRFHIGDSIRLNENNLISDVGYPNVSILLAELIGIEPLETTEDASSIFKGLEKNASLFKKAVHQKGGIVLDMFGTRYMAVFGMFPTNTPPSIQALNTVVSVLDYLKARKNEKELPHNISIDFKMSVASGKVWMRTAGSMEGNGPILTGECIRNALIIHTLPVRMDILVDKETYENAVQFKDQFKKKPLGFEYMGCSMEVFVWEKT